MSRCPVCNIRRGVKVCPVCLAYAKAPGATGKIYRAKIKQLHQADTGPQPQLSIDAEFDKLLCDELEGRIQGH